METYFLCLIGFNILFLSLLLTFIEFLKYYYVNLIGIFGFISATSSILIQILQYLYVNKRIKIQLKPFLKHSIIGYGVLFLFSILLYYLVEYTNYSDIKIAYTFTIIIFLLWILYFIFFRNIF